MDDRPADESCGPFFFPFSGPPAESVGLLTGEVTSLTSSFTITQGGTTITGTKSLVPNGGNWGVCLQPTDDPIGGNFGGAPLNGEIYILGAGVLSYEAEIDDGTPTTESGLAESYSMNSYLTCCSSGSPTQVNSATGHFNSGFGTTHPASGTSGSAPTTAPGTVEPLPEVEITFGTVNAPGTTTAVLTTTAPAIPAGFQIGNPPAFYEISTTADVAFPVTVCLGFGALPAGTTEPTLFHYEGGQWVDVTTTFTFSPNQVCGERQLVLAVCCRVRGNGNDSRGDDRRPRRQDAPLPRQAVAGACAQGAAPGGCSCTHRRQAEGRLSRDEHLRPRRQAGAFVGVHGGGEG